MLTVVLIQHTSNTWCICFRELGRWLVKPPSYFLEDLIITFIKTTNCIICIPTKVKSASYIILFYSVALLILRYKTVSLWGTNLLQGPWSLISKSTQVLPWGLYNYNYSNDLLCNMYTNEGAKYQLYISVLIFFLILKIKKVYWRNQLNSVPLVVD